MHNDIEIRDEQKATKQMTWIQSKKKKKKAGYVLELLDKQLLLFVFSSASVTCHTLTHFN